MRNELSLPMPVGKLVPHRPPILMVETLLVAQDGAGMAEAVPKPGHPLVDEDGTLDSAAMIEMIAQTFAAIKGYEDSRQGNPVKRGFLVGFKKIRFFGTARQGDRLLVKVKTVGTFDDFAMAEGEVEKDGQIIASGTINIWIDNSGPENSK